MHSEGVSPREESAGNAGRSSSSILTQYTHVGRSNKMHMVILVRAVLIALDT
jgi:hypothetical protein